jgi:hypothetical protein
VTKQSAKSIQNLEAASCTKRQSVEKRIVAFGGRVYVTILNFTYSDYYQTMREETNQTKRTSEEFKLTFHSENMVVLSLR